MKIPLNQLLNCHSQIDTPALLVDRDQIETNIQEMQTIANMNTVRLRPHIKTHKSSEIAHMQLAAGAVGITVAKTSEAETMAAAGISDIFIANQVTHPIKLKRLADLHQKITISVGIDHPQQVRILQERFCDAKHPLSVLVEIDSGLKRCGVTVGENLINLALAIRSAPGLKLSGIFTHAGQVYGAQSIEEIERIGREEGQIMATAVRLLNQNKITIDTVSVGSTPTARYAASETLVNEIRPGNYVFYDNIQLALGVCDREQISMIIMATVISQPAADRIVIDAGSKALNLDRGAHAVQQVSGFGRLLNVEGEINRLSEEHGMIQLKKPKQIPIGSPVLIVPNHACAVANLYAQYHFIAPSGDLRMVPVDGRGKSQ